MKDYKEITSKEAETIIETRKPLGLFWLKENGWYVAIDNSTGDAWTEDFRTERECIDYLKGSEPMQSFTE
ncbi:MAG: hypothetical protein ACRCVJ_18370 [Clostridium sp.]|uniref:hypothetical protein n=1 Tax=Clostridium sp. TaxID=1506 RepID=UPI003F2A74BB